MALASAADASQRLSLSLRMRRALESYRLRPQPSATAQPRGSAVPTLPILSRALPAPRQRPPAADPPDGELPSDELAAEAAVDFDEGQAGLPALASDNEAGAVDGAPQPPAGLGWRQSAAWKRMDEATRALSASSPDKRALWRLVRSIGRASRRLGSVDAYADLYLRAINANENPAALLEWVRARSAASAMGEESRKHSDFETGLGRSKTTTSRHVEMLAFGADRTQGDMRPALVYFRRAIDDGGTVIGQSFHVNYGDHYFVLLTDSRHYARLARFAAEVPSDDDTLPTALARLIDEGVVSSVLTVHEPRIHMVRGWPRYSTLNIRARRLSSYSGGFYDKPSHQQIAALWMSELRVALGELAAVRPRPAPPSLAAAKAQEAAWRHPYRWLPVYALALLLGGLWARYNAWHWGAALLLWFLFALPPVPAPDRQSTRHRVLNALLAAATGAALATVVPAYLRWAFSL